MTTNTDPTSLGEAPVALEGVDEEVVEYIDYLHDRIQFLTSELEDAERTVLALSQESTREVGSDRGGGSDQVTTDIENITQYVRWLAYKFDADSGAVEKFAELIADVLRDEVEGESDVHHASLALWVILRYHEEKWGN